MCVFGKLAQTWLLCLWSVVALFLSTLGCVWKGATAGGSLGCHTLTPFLCEPARGPAAKTLINTFLWSLSAEVFADSRKQNFLQCEAGSQPTLGRHSKGKG